MNTDKIDHGGQQFLDVLTGLAPPDEVRCPNCEGGGCSFCLPDPDPWDEDAENWRDGTMRDGMRRWYRDRS